jgi:hypothetical protein
MRHSQWPAPAVKTALALIGFSAVIGQIVLMRELIVVFSGNEMSLGILLATWLFWTAAGSSLSSVLRLGERNPRNTSAALECLLAACMPADRWRNGFGTTIRYCTSDTRKFECFESCVEFETRGLWASARKGWVEIRK